MTRTPPKWGDGSRFYLPNEDAEMVRRALTALAGPIRKPVFVGGSGMVLLDALLELPDVDRVAFVDLAEFQTHYFQRLLSALAQAASPRDLLDWFADEIHPELHDHFLRRGHDYPLEKVLQALDDRFCIRFFSDDVALRAARRAIPRITVSQNDILSHLVASSTDFDFVYLSNVPDYLSKNDLSRLFLACREKGAPVYLLLTSACNDPDLVRRAWEHGGYRSQAISTELSSQNKGLGSHSLNAVWNRPGNIHLLLPASDKG